MNFEALFSVKSKKHIIYFLFSVTIEISLKYIWDGKQNVLFIFEGVDDNGAGCAAMLEVARQLTEMNVKRQNTIIFVSFDVEERSNNCLFYFSSLVMETVNYCLLFCMFQETDFYFSFQTLIT